MLKPRSAYDIILADGVNINMVEEAGYSGRARQQAACEVSLRATGDGVASWKAVTQKRVVGGDIASDFPWKTRAAYLEVPDAIGWEIAFVHLKLLERPRVLSKLTTFGFQFRQVSGLEGPWPVLFAALEGDVTDDSSVPHSSTLGYCMIVGWSPDWDSKVVSNYNTWVKYPHTGAIPNTSISGAVFSAILFDKNGVAYCETDKMDWATLVALLIDGGSTSMQYGGTPGTVTLPANIEPVIFRFDVRMGATDGRSGEVNAAYVSDLEIAGQLYDIGY